MSNSQNAKPTLVMALAFVLAGAGAGFFFMLAPQEGPSEVDLDRPAVPGPTVASESPRAVSESPSPRAPDELAPVGEVAPGSDAKHKPNRLARDREREQIWSALGRKHNLKPAAPGSAAPSEAAAALLPTLDAEYVRGAIKEQLVPVAVDCYNTVLQGDAKAAGSLVFEFTIIGDEEIGGVVETVEIGEESTFEDEFLRECLSESLLAVTFPPPPDGGRVEVKYPMHFDPGEEDE